MKKRLIFMLLCIAVVMSTMAIPSFAAEPATVAHWKLQNVDGYYTGTMNDKDFGFKDLTGNGNDLLVAFEGNAAEIDGGVFEWGKGSTLDAKSDSSLYFGNTIDAAKSVDPYAPDETSYTGAYTSGMYFTTVDGAPINAATFDKGFTLEVVFKLDATFNMNYNRYTGIFSRQGLYNNEPLVSIAVAECDQDANGYFTGRMGLQYLYTDKDKLGTLNNEIAYDSGIDPEVWVHYALVVDEDGMVEVFVNGESVNVNTSMGMGIANDGFKWDVGVGRKDFTGKEAEVKGESYAEGGIRRLFCGSISEIRVTEGALPVESTLWGGSVNYEAAAAPVEEAPETEAVTEAPAAEVVETEAPAEEVPAVEAPVTEAPVTTAPQTNDPIVIASIICAAAVIAVVLARKKRVI